MNVQNVKCPNCGANLGELEEGRINIFCSYCGAALQINFSENDIDNIVKIKRADTQLNNSRARAENSNARRIEAENQNIIYKDSKGSYKRIRLLGFLIFLLGIALLFGLIFLLTFLIKEDAFSSIIRTLSQVGDDGDFLIWFVGSVGFLLVIGIFYLSFLLFEEGIAKMLIPSGKEREKIEKKINQYEKKLIALNEEAEQLRAIVMESGSSFLGLISPQKRTAKKRLEEINAEKESIERDINKLQNKLEGNI